jgi:transcription elongation factor GreA
MTADPTVQEAISSYVARVPQAERDLCSRELNRFARWFGFEKPLSAIRPIDLERFQEQLAQTGADPRRLEPLRQFLSDARAKKLLTTSLAVHIRIRSKRSGRANGTGVEAPTLAMTEVGYANLKAELERLETDVRPQIQADMQRAAADKDMRENAPYHAAKEKLSEVQSRMNMLKASLSAAEIVENNRSGQRVGMGTTLVVCDVTPGADEEELTYTLVGPGEIDPRRGRISIQSPMGRALADHAAGDMVEVETPVGRHLYRIQRVEES